MKTANNIKRLVRLANREAEIHAEIMRIAGETVIQAGEGHVSLLDLYDVDTPDMDFCDECGASTGCDSLKDALLQGVSEFMKEIEERNENSIRPKIFDNVTEDLIKFYSQALVEAAQPGNVLVLMPATGGMVNPLEQPKTIQFRRYTPLPPLPPLPNMLSKNEGGTDINGTYILECIRNTMPMKVETVEVSAAGGVPETTKAMQEFREKAFRELCRPERFLKRDDTEKKGSAADEDIVQS